MIYHGFSRFLARLLELLLELFSDLGKNGKKKTLRKNQEWLNHKAFEVVEQMFS